MLTIDIYFLAMVDVQALIGASSPALEAAGRHMPYHEYNKEYDEDEYIFRGEMDNCAKFCFEHTRVCSYYFL